MTNKTIDSDILKAVTTDWLSSRDIWKLVDCWVENTIATRLKLMAEEGLIDRRRKTVPTGFRWEYRKL